MKHSHSLHLATLATAIVLLAAACGGGAQSGSPAATSGTESINPATRPSSPAVLSIVQPTDGATITGSSVHVVLQLKNATIVQATSTNVVPDEGHIHLYVDNAIVSMNYSLEQDLPVTPGVWILKAEFVASDHAPFNPRVWSNQVQFTVQ